MFGRATIRLGIGPHSSSYYLFLLTFPICIFPSSFFMRLTFSYISSSISYLPEYGPAPFPGWRS